MSQQRTKRSIIADPMNRGRTATVKGSGDTASINVQPQPRKRSRSKIPKSLRYDLENALVGRQRRRRASSADCCSTRPTALRARSRRPPAHSSPPASSQIKRSSPIQIQCQSCERRRPVKRRLRRFSDAVPAQRVARLCRATSPYPNLTSNRHPLHPRPLSHAPIQCFNNYVYPKSRSIMMNKSTQTSFPWSVNSEGNHKKTNNQNYVNRVTILKKPNTIQRETENPIQKTQVEIEPRLANAKTSTCIRNNQNMPRRQQKKHCARHHSEPLNRTVNNHPDLDAKLLEPAATPRCLTEPITLHRQSRRKTQPSKSTLFQDDLITLLADMNDKSLRVLYKSPPREESNSILNILPHARYGPSNHKKTPPWR